VVLDHRRRLLESKDPVELKKQLELEADSYATRLVFSLYYAFALEYDQGVDLVETNKKGEEDNCLDGMSFLLEPTAANTFFKVSYSFAGFVDDPTRYPSVEQRLKNVSKVQQQTLDEAKVLIALQPKKNCKAIVSDLRTKVLLLPEFVRLHGISVYDLRPMFILSN